MPTLREEFETLAKQTGEKLMSLNFEDKDVYVRWIEQHHFLVKHTMRYICLAAGLSQAEDAATFSYWMQALKEETNHHKMLENDARNLGAKVDAFQPKPITESLATTVTNGMIDSQGKALFGYALLLEGMSCTVGGAFERRIKAAHGPKAATFLTLHTHVDDGDDGHFAHGLDFVEENYSPAEKESIRALLLESARAYEEIVRSVA